MRFRPAALLQRLAWAPPAPPPHTLVAPHVMTSKQCNPYCHNQHDAQLHKQARSACEHEQQERAHAPAAAHLAVHLVPLVRLGPQQSCVALLVHQQVRIVHLKQERTHKHMHTSAG
jgi:hypothetical protein